jgi:hypothetical protein
MVSKPAGDECQARRQMVEHAKSRMTHEWEYQQAFGHKAVAKSSRPADEAWLRITSNYGQITGNFPRPCARFDPP